MPVDPQASVEITGFSSIPPFAYGLVRDLRVRWTLEELGRSYRTRLYDRLDGNVPRAGFVIPDHPFSQVPGMVDGDVAMFESGAICLHFADGDDVLMPTDAPTRALTQSWALAAVSSVEPFVTHYQLVAVFDHDKPGAAQFTPVAEERLRGRLNQLSAALGSRDWLCGRFTVADILMAHVLMPPSLASVGLPANLADYVARAQARPAYQRALDAQIADLTHAEADA